MKINDRIPLPGFEPMVARDGPIVFIRLSVTSAPLVERRLVKPDPLKDLLGRQFGAPFPVVGVIDDGIANIVRDPFAVQGPPLAFFNLTCSSSSSATTSFLF